MAVHPTANMKKRGRRTPAATSTTPITSIGMQHAIIIQLFTMHGLLIKRHAISPKASAADPTGVDLDSEEKGPFSLTICAESVRSPSSCSPS